MNKENTEKLLNKFPLLYEDLNWGFECGDGWFQLIWDLSLKLEGERCKAVQVKEKFGGLRFYTDYLSEKGWDYVCEAEEESYNICELCGKPGVLRKGGWMRTLCKDCNDTKV